MGKPLDVARDWWLPVGLGVLTVFDISDTYADEPVGRRIAMLSVLLPLCAVLAWRRRRPATVAVTACALTLCVVVTTLPDLTAQPPFSPFIAVMAALFSLGLHADRAAFARAAALCAALLGSLELVQLLAGRPPEDLVPSMVFWAAAAGVGRLVHASRQETRTERERALRAEDERDLHAWQATVAERSRIARELHDVVAHSLSVMVIQASVEARLLGDRDDSTARTLRSIESTGREALVELRRLLGLLRTDEDTTMPLQPLPSLWSLAEPGGMLDDVRAAGHAVTLAVRGQKHALPPGTALSAYRVVQEALTNVVKHAPGASVAVVIETEDDGVTVEVANDAGHPGVGQDLGGGGHGLSGMRERVRLYDGSLTAGPREDGGWLVRATFRTTLEPA